MTPKEMFKMRQKGATYQEIADEVGISRQAIYKQIEVYVKRTMTSYRGKGFYLDDIKFQGIYDYFKENEEETISSFTKKIFDNPYASKTQTIRDFITGKHNAYFNIDQIKCICDVIGKPFALVFKERETDG